MLLMNTHNICFYGRMPGFIKALSVEHLSADAGVSSSNPRHITCVEIDHEIISVVVFHFC